MFSRAGARNAKEGSDPTKYDANILVAVKGKSKAPVQEDDEEEELRKLQAEMAM